MVCWVSGFLKLAFEFFHSRSCAASEIVRMSRSCAASEIGTPKATLHKRSRNLLVAAAPVLQMSHRVQHQTLRPMRMNPARMHLSLQFMAVVICQLATYYEQASIFRNPRERHPRSSVHDLRRGLLMTRQQHPNHLQSRNPVRLWIPQPAKVQTPTS